MIQPDPANLFSYWSLDETSGTRVDLHAGRNATPVNAPGYAAGLISNAASFVAASSQTLTVTNDAALQGIILGDFSVCFGVYMYSFPVSPTYEGVLYTKGTWATGGIDIKMPYNDKTAFIFNGGKNQAATIHADAFGTGTYLNTWNYAVCTHDATAKMIYIYCNGSLRDSLGYVFDIFASDAVTSYIGSVTLGHYMDGRIDELSIWTHCMSLDEVQWMYNGGLIRSYSDVVPSAAVAIPSKFGV